EADIAALVSADDAADAIEYSVYDGAGRRVATVDAGGFVGLYYYDSTGRMTREWHQAEATAITSALRSALEAGTAAYTDVTAVEQASSSRDHIVYRSFDAAGRLRYVMTLCQSAHVAVEELRYDAAGRLTSRLAYGQVVDRSQIS